MSDRDELIAKARELDGSATSGPWRHDNVQHQNSVTSIERIITPWGLQFYDAQFIAESRTLLPALADLAESEGRRADRESETLLKIAAAFNGWANAGSPDGGPSNAITAAKVLEAIGEALGDPLKGQQP